MCPNGIRLNFFEEKTYRDMKRKKKKNLKSKKRDIEEEFYDADEFFDIGGYSHPTQAEKESMTSLIDNQGWDSSYLISRNSKYVTYSHTHLPVYSLLSILGPRI